MGRESISSFEEEAQNFKFPENTEQSRPVDSTEEASEPLNSYKDKFKGELLADKASQFPESASVEELESPIFWIIDQLKDKLKDGHFQVLIGDDASGRIPSLIFKKVIDHIYEKNGHQKPELKFFSGTKGNIKADLKESNTKAITEFATKQGLAGKNALLITDYIQSGAGMVSLTRGLENAGINLEVATMALNEESKSIAKNVPYPIHDGENIVAPLVYGRYDLGGVRKDKVNRDSIHAKRFRDTAPGFSDQEDINMARRDADIVAAKIIKWYDSLEPENK